MPDLILCASCERHFRPGDAQCPFCGGVAIARAPVARAAKGLSRARLYALHTAALATGVAMAVACGGDTTTGGDASTDGSSNKDATSDTTTSDVTTSDATNDVALDQSSSDASADVVEDDGWGPPPPPYGCVFPGGCGSVTV
jgi:hypothetical protein